MKRTTPFILAFCLQIIALPLFCQFNPVDKIEKGYIQTDKPMYRPGDNLWVKAWIVNGANQPGILSQMATLEMIKPDGSTLFSKDITIENGAITDFQYLDSSIPGGIYQLKVHTLWMTELEKEKTYSKDIIIQKYDPPRLLMKLELDKEAYGKGEIVNASFEVKDLQDRSINNVDIDFTIYEDGQTIQKHTQKTEHQGEARIHFDLPADLSSTNISINAKLTYRGQTESLSKRVPILLENIDLQFLPEGGFISSGHENIIAFKAVSSISEPADVKGEILDALGQKVMDFESSHDGMGKIRLTPKKGNSYFAKICSPYEAFEKIPLGEVYHSAPKITLSEHTENHLKIDLLDCEKMDLTVQLSKSYETVWSQMIYASSNKNGVLIPTSDYPQGIYKLTLCDEAGILSERLVFLHPKKQMQVSVTLDKEKYGLRDKVSALIQTKDHLGNPIPADLGLAVTEDKMLSFADDKQAYLTTELLLSSELKGKIHEPNYYFDSITMETIEHLDLVMLTHGWRSHLTSTKDEDAMAYFITQNSYLGQVRNQFTNEGVKAKIMVYNPTQKKASILNTDEDGIFLIPFHNESTFQIYAKSDVYSRIHDLSVDDLKSNKAKSILALENRWYAKVDVPNEMVTPFRDLAQQNFEVQKKEGLQQIEEEYEDMNIAMSEGALLDEIVVTGYGVDRISFDNTTSDMSATVQSITSLPLKNINAIAGTTAGIVASNNQNIGIRGSRSAPTAYYIDGVRVSGLIPQAMEDLDLDEHVLNRYYQNLFETKSSIPVAYKHIQSRKKRSHTVSFYIPKYESNRSRERTDFRQTIYWNPRIQTDKNGQAEIQFFTSDEITSFSVIAEGITAEGQVGRGIDKIITTKPLNIDCKLPSFLVQGDTAQLAVIVHNDSGKDQKIDLSINVKGMKVTNADIQNEIIKKGKSRNFAIQVIPQETIKNAKIEMGVKSKTESDYFSKSLDVLNPYFPIQLAQSGVDTDTFDFVLSEPIANSVSAQFKTYNPINSALEGIESLLRQPSGCFEQTSSSTYPNVMVYQYLQRNNSDQDEAMEKAMKYIKAGYKRLVGFETTEDGFEWFGNAPGHVALTAYGLLEFTDMAKIYDGVDEKMLNRTIDFLLKKKDGKGGFKNSSGLDGFGSVSYEVQNAYVLYALTSQKLREVAIDNEYAASKTVALQDNDPYLIALMANTAFNLGKIADYKNFIRILFDEIQQKPLSEILSNQTITRSGQKDNNLETLALTALAIMKGDESNKPIVMTIINHILSNRRGGRFGSTQATCLSIQAILTYADWNSSPHSNKDGEVIPIVDGVPISISEQIQKLSAHFTQNNHSIIVDYSKPSGKSYELTLDYMSKTPPTTKDPELDLRTTLINSTCAVADLVSMEVTLTNNRNKVSANPTIMIGIPSGLSLKVEQLKELTKSGEIAFFEIFKNRLVIYLNELSSLEEKRIQLDFKAEIAGKFTSPASCAYPYYDDQNKTWIKGVKLDIQNTKSSDHTM